MDGTFVIRKSFYHVCRWILPTIQKEVRTKFSFPHERRSFVVILRARCVYGIEKNSSMMENSERGNQRVLLLAKKHRLVGDESAYRVIPRKKFAPLSPKHPEL
jgi:hypothetical protein